MTMNKEEALKIIEQGLQLANQKGAYTLQDSHTLFQALSVIKSPDEDKENAEDIEYIN